MAYGAAPRCLCAPWSGCHEWAPAGGARRPWCRAGCASRPAAAARRARGPGEGAVDSVRGAALGPTGGMAHRGCYTRASYLYLPSYVYMPQALLALVRSVCAGGTTFPRDRDQAGSQGCTPPRSAHLRRQALSGRQVRPLQVLDVVVKLRGIGLDPGADGGVD